MAFDDEQQKNAQTIIRVGRSLGATDRDIQIALMTAIVESGLRNVPYGDRDSVGLFQQRDPWGSYEQRMDPAQSARMFFQGGMTGQPGLFDKAQRANMTMGQAAQAVQVSAFPDRYAEHESEAAQLLGAVSGGSSHQGGAEVTGVSPGAGISKTATPTAPQPVAPSSPGIAEMPAPEETVLDPEAFGVRDIGNIDEGEYLPTLSQEDFMSALGGGQLPGVFGRELAPVAASGGRKKAVDYAIGLIGAPYKWGGQDPSGVDCSGLTYSSLAAAGVDVPRVSYAQANSGARIGQGQARPGDLWATDNSARNDGADHVAMYLGDGWIVEAFKPGEPVRKRRLSASEAGWFVDMSGAYGDA